MTERSTRRAAELAVIEAARLTVAAYGSPDGDTEVDALLDLEGFLRELDKLGLADPGRARADKGAPVTAQQAAIWMNGDKAKSLCARIMRLMARDHSWYTEEQIEQMLHGKHQTISPRMTELRDTGWITDSGYKMKTSSGREAIAWKLSHAARQAINGQEGLPI